MDSPMTRRAAIERVTAMRHDNGQTWDLSPKDQEALRHAVNAFSDVGTLQSEADRLRVALIEIRSWVEKNDGPSWIWGRIDSALGPFRMCGCGDSNCNDCAGAPR